MAPHTRLPALLPYFGSKAADLYRWGLDSAQLASQVPEGATMGAVIQAGKPLVL